MQSDKYTSEHLLSDTDYSVSDDAYDEETQPTRKRNGNSWKSTILFIMYFPLAIVHILLWIKWTQLPTFPSPIDASRAIIYETRPLNIKTAKYSPFVGDPRPELDAAWHTLFETNNIRVEKSDLDALNLTSLQLKDGGYIAQPAVFHELHCLKRVRHWAYKEHYLSNTTAVQMKEHKAHVDHCIEMLRKSAICRGDTALSTFRWLYINGTAYPTAEDKGPHKCVNWKGYTGYVEKNKVDLKDLKQAPMSTFGIAEGSESSNRAIRTKRERD